MSAVLVCGSGRVAGEARRVLLRMLYTRSYACAITLVLENDCHGARRV